MIFQRIFPFIFITTLMITSCSPRPVVIESGVAATLTSLAPTSIVPLDRPTSTSVPVVVPSANTPIPPTKASVAVTPSQNAAPATSVASASNVAPATAAPPTSLPTSTATATAAPTATESAAQIKLGELIFEEKFEAQGPWSIGDAGDSVISIAGGALTYLQKNPGSYSIRIISRQGDDFYAEVGATPPSNCGTLDKYGLIFRAQDTSNYYVFQLDCEGRYRVLRFGGTAANPLVDWTTSSAISRGSKAFNLLGLQAKGNTFTLYINQIKVDTVTDSAYANGRFGLWVGSNITRDLSVKFTAMKAYKLP